MDSGSIHAFVLRSGSQSSGLNKLVAREHLELKFSLIRQSLRALSKVATLKLVVSFLTAKLVMVPDVAFAGLVGGHAAVGEDWKSER